MALKYKIKNWEKYQHYTDRNPPWIKLHVETLASADWVMLADASKLLMIVCMMLAAKERGVFLGDLDYIKRVAYLDKRPNLTPLIDCGFIEEVQADAIERKHKLADARPEKEAEAEAEKEKKDTPIAPKGAVYPKDFESFWTLYPEKKGKDAALRAWKKRDKNATLPSLEVIVEAIGRYIGGKPADVNYKHPATWINGGCWLDEYSTPAPAVTTDPTTTLTMDDWRNAARRFLKDDYWPPAGYGPQPGYGGCRVPAAIISEFNLDGLTPPNFLKRTA